MRLVRKWIEWLDLWWSINSPKRRIDHNAANLYMLAALILSSLSIVLQGPVPSSVLEDMPDGLQVAMCACISIGCSIKLHGALSGSRWYFPKTRLKKSYRWGYTGAPMATVGCLVYGWFILSGTDTFLSALGGVATPLFGIGISHQAVLYWLESRRIAHNEHALIEQAKEVIRHERDGNGSS